MDLNEKTATRDGWSDIETVFFMERYNLYKDDVGKGKQFKTRKQAFEIIAGEMSTCLQSKKTEQQLTTKYYTLTRRNKKTIPVVNMTQGTVVDMNLASVVEIQNIQIMDMDNFVVDRNKTATSVVNMIQGATVDTNEATDVGIENIQIMDIQDFVVDCNDAKLHDSETDVVVETGVTEPVVNQTVSENGSISTDLTFVDAIVRGVDRINNQNRFTRFEGPPRSSTPPTVGIATIYSMSDNMTTSIDLTGTMENQSDFASLNVVQTLGIGESSNTNLTSSRSSNTNESSSRAASQSLPKTLPNHGSNRVTNVRAEAASSVSSRNLSISKKSKAPVSFTDEETKWLLDQYYTYMDEIGPMKLFRTKNVMWQTLASKMNVVFDSTRTADDLSKRVANVIELKKTAVSRNGLSGEVRTRIEYQEELEKIAALDDSIEPEVMRGIKYVKYKKNIKKSDHNEEQQSGKKPRWDKPNKKEILNSLSQTMMAIEKRKSERDAAKEERRNESQKVLLGLLTSLKKSEN